MVKYLGMTGKMSVCLQEINIGLFVSELHSVFESLVRKFTIVLIIKIHYDQLINLLQCFFPPISNRQPLTNGKKTLLMKQF